jgi:hypothetical protein
MLVGWQPTPRHKCLAIQGDHSHGTLLDRALGRFNANEIAKSFPPTADANLPWIFRRNRPFSVRGRQSCRQPHEPKAQQGAIKRRIRKNDEGKLSCIVLIDRPAADRRGPSGCDQICWLSPVCQHAPPSSADHNSELCLAQLSTISRPTRNCHCRYATNNGSSIVHCRTGDES